jgi:hypothetical protein
MRRRIVIEPGGRCRGPSTSWPRATTDRSVILRFVERFIVERFSVERLVDLYADVFCRPVLRCQWALQ